MEAFFQALGHKAFHGRNVLKWIHKHGVTDFDAMTDLPKALRATLREIAEVVVRRRPGAAGGRRHSQVAARAARRPADRERADP